MKTPAHQYSWQPWAAALGLAVAFWPVWRWYAMRTVDGSDEPWGVLALVVATGFAIVRRDGVRRLAPIRIGGLCVCVLLYAVLFSYAPILLLAIIAMITMGIWVMSALSRAGLGLPWLGLLVLSLPVMATLQFYVGYPMRWATAWGATGLLNTCGVHVVRQGLSLVFAGERILIDVPCSGVRMLWAGGFLASALACALRLSSRQTMMLWSLAACAVLVGNMLRAVWIFLDKSQLIVQPAWMHSGAGVLIFALVGWGVMSAALRLERSSPCAV